MAATKAATAGKKHPDQKNGMGGFLRSWIEKLQKCMGGYEKQDFILSLFSNNYKPPTSVDGNIGFLSPQIDPHDFLKTRFSFTALLIKIGLTAIGLVMMAANADAQFTYGQRVYATGALHSRSMVLPAPSAEFSVAKCLISASEQGSIISGPVSGVIQNQTHTYTWYKINWGGGACSSYGWSADINDLAAVAATTGSFQVTLQNIGGVKLPSGTPSFVVYKSPGYSLVNRYLAPSGTTTVSGLTSGTYIVEGYSPPTFNSTGEYWGSTTIRIPPTRTYVVSRRTPYTSGTPRALVNASTISGSLTAGTQVTFSIPLSTKNTSCQQARVKVYVSQQSSLPSTWQTSTTAPTSNFVSVCPGSSQNAVVLFTPTATGTYYWSFEVDSNVGGPSDPVKTDSWPWKTEHTFTVTAVNHAPTLMQSSTSGSSVTVGQAYAITVSTADVDGNLSHVDVNWNDGKPVERKAVSGNQAIVTFRRSFSTARTINWTANAYDKTSLSSNRLSGSFSVNAALAVPTLTSPANGSSLAAGRTSVSLQWTGAGSSYNIGVYTGSCEGSLFTGLSTPLSTFPVSSLTSGTTYYWRVQAVSSGGVSAYTSCYSFSVNASTAHAPTLMQSNTSGPSVAVGQAYVITVRAADVDGNLSKVDVNWNDGAPVEHKTVSGSQASVTFSRPFSMAQTINWTANAYDTAGLRSNTLSGSFNVNAALSSPFSGKGDWIVNIQKTIKNLHLLKTGDPIVSLIQYEKSIGIQYLIVKAGQGDHYFPSFGPKLDASFVRKAHAAGIKVYGFHYVYGGAYDPYNTENTDVNLEVQVARKILATGVDGLIIDAELEYEDGQYRFRMPGPGTLPSAASAANSYCQGILKAYPKAVLAYSPIWDPKANPGFPYSTFNKYSVAVMPQAYSSIHSTSSLLKPVTPEKMIQQLDNVWKSAQKNWISKGLPIVPVVYAVPPVTGQEITDFVKALKTDPTPATSGGYQGVSFYDADSHNAEIRAAISAATIGAGSTSGITPPTINAFSVSPFTSTQGQHITINYTVSDTGGSGLNRVVLRRTSGSGLASDLGWHDIGTNLASGDGPISGSFSDTPPSVGTYSYGMAVFDSSGNSENERQSGRGPLPVVVTTAAVPLVIKDSTGATLTTKQTVAPTGSLTVTPAGGSGRFVASITSPANVVTRLAADANGKYTFTPQTTGAFAGDYTLTLTDATSGLSTTLEINVPLKVTVSRLNILESDHTQTVTVSGGSAYDVFSVVVLDVAESGPNGKPTPDTNVNKIAANILPVTAVPDAAKGNPATATIIPANVTAITPFSVQVADNTQPALSVAQSRRMNIIAENPVVLTITDANTTAPIKGATVVLRLPDPIIAKSNVTTTTDAQGVATPTLPIGPLVFDVTATGYLPGTITLVQGATIGAVALTPITSPVNYTGTINAVAPFTLPADTQVIAVDANGNKVAVITGSTPTFTLTIDSNVFVPVRFVATATGAISDVQLVPLGGTVVPAFTMRARPAAVPSTVLNTDVVTGKPTEKAGEETFTAGAPAAGASGAISVEVLGKPTATTDKAKPLAVGSVTVMDNQPVIEVLVKGGSIISAPVVYQKLADTNGNERREDAGTKPMAVGGAAAVTFSIPALKTVSNVEVYLPVNAFKVKGAAGNTLAVGQIFTTVSGVVATSAAGQDKAKLTGGDIVEIDMVAFDGAGNVLSTAVGNTNLDQGMEIRIPIDPNALAAAGFDATTANAAFTSGKLVINTAPTIADFEAGKVTEVPGPVTYDPLTGEAVFFAKHFSAFGAAPAPAPAPTPTPAPGAGAVASGGGGGCTLSSAPGKIDPMLPLLALMAAISLWWRRRRQRQS